MKLKINNFKAGSALVIVMMIMVAFGMMTTALLQLGSFSQMESIKQLRTAQARWLAEAGLERVLSWVAASETYRGNLPSSEPAYSSAYTELPHGEYRMKTWAPSNNTIIIRAIGITTGNGISDSSTVQLSLHYTSGIPGAIIGLNMPGHTYLGKDVNVVGGDVYRNGTMDIDGSLDERNNAYATSPPITGGGDFVENYIPDPDPPLIDKDRRFANLISAASAQTNTVFDGILNNNTVYVNGDLTLNKGISGSGILVVSGNLFFNGVKQSIDDNVEVVVDGNITINNHTSFGDNVEIFSEDGNISLQHDIDGGTTAIIAKNGSVGHIQSDYDNSLGKIDTAHVLSSGHDIGDQNPSNPGFKGVMYAGYDIILRHKADIYGTIIAGRHLDIGHSSNTESMRITYDPTVFDENWQLDFGNEIAGLNSDWQEL